MQVRLGVNQARRTKLQHADPEIRAAEVGERPTFVGTAREFGDRVFGPPQPGHSTHVPFHHHDLSSRDRSSGTGVNRSDVEGGDPELPSYSEFHQAAPNGKIG